MKKKIIYFNSVVIFSAAWIFLLLHGSIYFAAAYALSIMFSILLGNEYK